MVRLNTVAGLVAVALLTATVPATADPVSDWNEVTLWYVQGNTVQAIPAGRGGPPGLLDIALVQTAVYDAVQAIEGRFEAYTYTDPTKLGVGSPAAAVAAAAHRTLVLLYPGQEDGLDDLYEAYLNDNGLAGDPALAVGVAAAEAVHAANYRPTINPPAFNGFNEPGQWFSAAPMAFLGLAFTTPYTLNRASQFRPQPPPPMTSEIYRREFEEVAVIGRSTSHPNADTDLARFWSGNFFIQWNEALRQVAVSAQLEPGDSARLFALAGLAAADAVIAVWESKYFYNFWRPDMAIQNGDDDTNKKTVGVPGWTPFLANPVYPEYVSGANGVTAAFTGAMRAFFGSDEFDFSVKNPAMAVVTKERFFERFSQAEEEVVEARILLGIHFRSADEEARRLGNRIAQWVNRHYLRPLPGSKSH
jgi:hypothetical protein